MSDERNIAPTFLVRYDSVPQEMSLGFKTLLTRVTLKREISSFTESVIGDCIFSLELSHTDSTLVESWMRCK